MTAESGGDPGRVDEADRAITALREELKYRVATLQVKTFAAAIARHLPHHRFVGEGANKLPLPRHFVTTIYFDTKSRNQYQASQDDHLHNLKMRAKEYYDLHPSLTELATDARQIVKFQPVLWLELKFKDGTKTGKRRIGIPKKQVPGFFGQGTITPEMIDLQRQEYGSDGEQVLREIAGYVGRYAEPFVADCLVSYRRLPWQDEAGTLRVTLDVGLEFYAPPEDLWQRNYALVRETLGPIKGRIGPAILEVKARGTLPTWLDELLVTVGATPDRFSKFEEASRAVHG